jgi:hypothetical protein
MKAADYLLKRGEHSAAFAFYFLVQQASSLFLISHILKVSYCYIRKNRTRSIWDTRMGLLLPNFNERVWAAIFIALASITAGASEAGACGSFACAAMAASRAPRGGAVGRAAKARCRARADDRGVATAVVADR